MHETAMQEIDGVGQQSDYKSWKLLYTLKTLAKALNMLNFAIIKLVL